MQFRFDPGAHVCHLFENPEEQLGVIQRFCKAGLILGERCTVITSKSFVHDLYLQLEAYGVDVVHEREQESLEVLEASKWYLAGGDAGTFNSVVMAGRLWRMIAGTLLRFAGLRLVADMTWTVESLLPEDLLCHWEAAANLIFEGSDACAICQYDLKRLSPAAVHNALRTHPLVILDGRVLSSPYYEAPEILAKEPDMNHSDADAGDVEMMLTRLRSS